MKKLILLLSLLLIFSCKKEEEKNNDTSIIEAVEGVQEIKKAGNALKDFEKRIEELKNLEPISKEIFKEILIENIGDLKRTDYSSGNSSMIGLSSGEATYSDKSSKTIKVSIFDGAGKSGSAMLAMTNMSLAMDIEEIKNTITKKTEEIDGIRCLTENDTNPNYSHSSILFIYKDRFQVNLEGNQLQIDDLKSFMKNLDLSKLN